jgi:hypothetical protein
VKWFLKKIMHATVRSIVWFVPLLAITLPPCREAACTPYPSFVLPRFLVKSEATSEVLFFDDCKAQSRSAK